MTVQERLIEVVDPAHGTVLGRVEEAGDEYGAMATMPRGHTLAGAWDATDSAAPEPRGVAAALVPWNDPIAIACGPIGACLPPATPSW